MNEYILVCSSMNGTDTTAIKIIATSDSEALSKAYSYFGGDSRFPVEDFTVFCEAALFDRVIRRFQDFTGQTILYFSVETDIGIIDEIQEIDIIKYR